jgi:hypothetical protein
VNLAPAGSFTPIRVNAGGPAYTDLSGQSWSVDTGFSGGSTRQTTATVVNTITPALYQTCRYGVMTYTFAVPNGTYIVKLKFAEMYLKKPGQRMFNVALNGQTVLTKFDILVAAGGPRLAVDQEFPVTISGGQIIIQFTQVKQTPMINAIEVVRP